MAGYTDGPTSPDYRYSLNADAFDENAMYGVPIPQMPPSPGAEVPGLGIPVLDHSAPAEQMAAYIETPQAAPFQVTAPVQEVVASAAPAPQFYSNLPPAVEAELRDLADTVSAAVAELARDDIRGVMATPVAAAACPPPLALLALSASPASSDRSGVFVSPGPTAGSRSEQKRRKIASEAARRRTLPKIVDAAITKINMIIRASPVNGKDPLHPFDLYTYNVRLPMAERISLASQLIITYKSNPNKPKTFPSLYEVVRKELRRALNRRAASDSRPLGERTPRGVPEDTTELAQRMDQVEQTVDNLSDQVDTIGDLQTQVMSLSKSFTKFTATAQTQAQQQESATAKRLECIETQIQHTSMKDAASTSAMYLSALSRIDEMKAANAEAAMKLVELTSIVEGLVRERQQTAIAVKALQDELARKNGVMDMPVPTPMALVPSPSTTSTIEKAADSIQLQCQVDTPVSPLATITALARTSGSVQKRSPIVRFGHAPAPQTH